MTNLRFSFLSGARVVILVRCHSLACQLLLLYIFCATLSSCATCKLGKRGQEKVAQKTYVIVGASSGLGRGMAETLGAYHANVVLAARRTELLEQVADSVREAGGKALVITMDISKQEDVNRLAKAAVDQFGRIDVWINNAGIGAIGRFWEVPPEDMARLIDINLNGFIYGSHEALQIFQKQGSGTLINVGSVESEVPQAYHAAYAASKAGVRSLSQAINQELRVNGYRKIKVVTIEPWATDTPWHMHAANYSGGTPQMFAIDGPAKVVNTMVRASVHPRRCELPVGFKARAAVKMHRLCPGFVERATANLAHKRQMKLAPPAPHTPGALYKPTDNGQGVEGGMRERQKRERKARKELKKHQ
jgi:short-subunit dehydrogenase